MSASVMTENPVRDSAVKTDKSLLQPEETVFVLRVNPTTLQLGTMSVNRILFNETWDGKLEADGQVVTQVTETPLPDHESEIDNQAWR